MSCDADRVHLGELAALAEDLEEGLGLRVGAVQGQALVDDDGPRDEGEEHEQDQDDSGHGPAVADQAAKPPEKAGAWARARREQKEQ